METQEVVDRMEDLIIDANRSVYYANGTGAAMGSAISDDIDGADSTAIKHLLSATNTKTAMAKTTVIFSDVIDWSKRNRRFTTADAASSKDDSGVQNADSEEEESGEYRIRSRCVVR